MALNLTLPNLNDRSLLLLADRAEVEQTLADVKQQVETKYQHRIQVLPTTLSVLAPDGKQEVLSYALYLHFVGGRDFSYRLFELTCQRTDSVLPVEVVAHAGPAEPFGIAHTKPELEAKIEEVFAHPRTRNVILTHYKM